MPTTLIHRAAFLLRCLLCSCVLVIVAPPTFAQGGDSEIVESPEPIPGLTSLLDEWQATVADSEEERGVERRIRALLQEADPELVVDLNRYWQAPPDSTDEAAAVDGILRSVTPDAAALLMAIYEPDQSQPKATAGIESIGEATAMQIQPVEIALAVPESLVAGESVTIFGKVTNHGDSPVWIVDTRSRLTVPQELWGVSADNPLTLIADFPTTPVMKEEALRLEAGSSHTIFWTIDRAAFETLNDQARLRDLKANCDAGDTAGCDEYKDKEAAIKEAIDDGPFARTLDQTINGLWTYLFFKPREYQLNADLHVWPVLPKYDTEFVTNLGDSYTITAARMVRFDAPQMVLVVGAILGGLIGFFLKITYHLTRRLTFADFAFGVPSVVLLCVIGTIMLSRLGESDFLINVQVQDFWGAVLTGFIVQWLGLNYVVDQLTRRVSPGKKPDAVQPVPVEPEPAVEENLEGDAEGAEKPAK